eukprot:1147385-Pelagomonas_calceolata.AAC.6
MLLDTLGTSEHCLTATDFWGIDRISLNDLHLSDIIIRPRSWQTMENVILREGRFGQYEQVNDSNLWINWTKQISAEGTTGRDRVPGPGVFYGQIREKDDPDTAYDCVVKCHLSEAFTEESRREVSEKRAAANIKLLKQARSPVHRGKADHDLAYHVVSSYSTEAIEPHGYSGRKRYILQPLELCSANLQNYMMSKGQQSSSRDVQSTPCHELGSAHAHDGASCPSEPFLSKLPPP